MLKTLSRRAIFLLVLLPSVLLAACGGSKQSSTKTATTSMTTSDTSATSTARTTSGTSGGGPSASGTAAATTTTTSRRSTSTTSSVSGAAGGSANARIPATFTIHAGETVTPSTVSAPAQFAVQLTLISADGRVHHAVLRTVIPYPVTVPANGRAVVLVPGQRAGRYALDVDGGPRAFLVIGPQPGP
jgi:hypothetical protein